MTRLSSDPFCMPATLQVTPRLACAAVTMTRLSAGPGVLALLSVLTALAALAPSSVAFVLSKCCHQEGELVIDNETGDFLCPDNDGFQANLQNVSTFAVSPFDVTGILEGRRAWLDWRHNVIHAKDLKRSNLSLAEILPNSTRVRYGVRPCTTYEQQKVFGKSGLWDLAYLLIANGSLILNLTAFKGAGELLLMPEEYCMDVYRKNSTYHNVILACPCARVPCFRKCCKSSEDYVFIQNKPQCKGTQGTSTWRPFRGQEQQPTHHLFTDRALQCNMDGGDIAKVHLNEIGKRRLGMTVLANGSATFEDVGALAAGLWCGESWRLEDGASFDTAYFCHRRTRRPPSPRLLAYAACLTASAVCLVLTLCVYWALPELRAQPHGKALMCHCAALLLGCVALASAQALLDVRRRLREFVALVIQFSFLSAFFWLSILSYDISRAFRGFHSSERDSTIEAQRTFLWYSIVSWGSPLLVSGTTATIAELQRADLLPNWIVSPNIGQSEFWFEGSASKWAYFNGPLLMLVVINTVLYATSAARLCGSLPNYKELMRGDSRVHGQGSDLTNNKRRFWLHSRLFLLMGVLWFFDAISPAFEGTAAKDDSESFHWWAIVDFVNMLRGVVLFFSYCCKPNVIRKLRKRTTELGRSGVHSEGEGRWPAWLTSAAAVSAAPTDPASSRYTSIYGLSFRHSAGSFASSVSANSASSGASGRRLKLRIPTQICSSRSSLGPGPSASPFNITPIPEYCEVPFPQCGGSVLGLPQAAAEAKAETEATDAEGTKSKAGVRPEATKEEVAKTVAAKEEVAKTVAAKEEVAKNEAAIGEAASGVPATKILVMEAENEDDGEC